MKKYNSPILVVEDLQLNDVIATSSFSMGDVKGDLEDLQGTLTW